MRFYHKIKISVQFDDGSQRYMPRRHATHPKDNGNSTPGSQITKRDLLESAVTLITEVYLGRIKSNLIGGQIP